MNFIEYQCPECEKICISKGGLKTHVTRVHNSKYAEIFGEKMGVKKGPQFDAETRAELNRQSNLNYLRTCNGDISQMNGRNRRILKKEGVLKNVERDNKLRRRLIYTDYGNELLKELQESGSP